MTMFWIGFGLGGLTVAPLGYFLGRLVEYLLAEYQDEDAAWGDYGKQQARERVTVMAPRTTASLVQAVLGDDYGPRLDGSLPDLTPFITAANTITNRVVACASAKGLALSDGGQDTEAEQVERWLAAYFYTKQDPIYSSKSTSGASGSFVRDADEANPYRGAAINIDYSGCLAAILKRQFAFFSWLGKPPSAQIPVEQRD